MNNEKYVTNNIEKCNIVYSHCYKHLLESAIDMLLKNMKNICAENIWDSFKTLRKGENIWTSIYV